MNGTKTLWTACLLLLLLLPWSLAAQAPGDCEATDSPCSCGYHDHDTPSWDPHNCSTNGSGGLTYTGYCLMNADAVLPSTPRHSVYCFNGLCDIQVNMKCGNAFVTATLRDCYYGVGMFVDSIGARCESATGQKRCECGHKPNGQAVLDCP